MSLGRNILRFHKMLYVIIPVYNTAPYLKECLDSVFSQGIDDMTVIAVNDGSTDGSLEILNTYCGVHPRLRVFHTENRGPSAARNLALDSINTREGDLITFIDSDDVFNQRYLNQMISKMKETGADVVCSSFSYYDGLQIRAAHLCGDVERVLSGFEATEELLLDQTIQSHSHCKLYKAPLWNDIRFPMGIVAMEDQATVFKTFCKTNTVCVTPLSGYLYRQRNDSVCSAPMTNKRVLDSIEGYLIPAEHVFDLTDGREGHRLHEAAVQALGSVFLMMIPRWCKRKASAAEIKRYHDLRQRMRRLHPVARFCPKTKKARVKKWFYLFLRPFYSPLYRIAVETF